jgi:CheY-like chemotaxis protein
MAKILIVDDDPGTRQLYVCLLTPFGHQVSVARDGEEGLVAARKLGPGLIISDILMPTMNGYEFVSRLRQFPGFEKVPVIFQSASFLDHEAQVLGQACGVDAYIAKPCEPGKILETVNRVLGLPHQDAMPASASESNTDPVPMLIDAFYEKGKQLDALTMRLASLLDFGLQLSRAGAPRVLLQHAVAAARKIVGANYAGAGAADIGDPRLQVFVTSGIDEATIARLGTPGLSGTFQEIVLQGKTIGAFSHVGETALRVLRLSRFATPLNEYSEVQDAVDSRPHSVRERPRLDRRDGICQSELFDLRDLSDFRSLRRLYRLRDFLAFHLVNPPKTIGRGNVMECQRNPG